MKMTFALRSLLAIDFGLLPSRAQRRVTPQADRACLWSRPNRTNRRGSERRPNLSTLQPLRPRTGLVVFQRPLAMEEDPNGFSKPLHGLDLNLFHHHRLLGGKNACKGRYQWVWPHWSQHFASFAR